MPISLRAQMGFPIQMKLKMIELQGQQDITFNPNTTNNFYEYMIDCNQTIL